MVVTNQSKILYSVKQINELLSTENQVRESEIRLEEGALKMDCENLLNHQ